MIESLQYQYHAIERSLSQSSWLFANHIEVARFPFSLKRGNDFIAPERRQQKIGSQNEKIPTSEQQILMLLDKIESI